MKKTILIALATIVATITTNQLLNSKINDHNIKTEINSSLNKDDEKITKLNQEYAARSAALNQAIKVNLTDSITLSNNEITINYQNLKPELYSEEIYQIIFSSDYLNALQIQYQSKIISFDADSHINFDKHILSTYNANFWTEGHWYWFGWWKLHLSYNAVTTIISYVTKLGGISAVTINKITEFIVGLMTSVVSTIIIIAIAVVIIGNFIILVGYSNHLPGCWLGILGVIPGIGWGSN